MEQTHNAMLEIGETFLGRTFGPWSFDTVLGVSLDKEDKRESGKQGRWQIPVRFELVGLTGQQLLDLACRDGSNLRIRAQARLRKLGEARLEAINAKRERQVFRAVELIDSKNRVTVPEPSMDQVMLAFYQEFAGGLAEALAWIGQNGEQLATRLESAKARLKSDWLAKRDAEKRASAVAEDTEDEG